MMNRIKKTAVNAMFATGMVLVLLATFAIIFGTESRLVPMVFEILGANIVVNLGLILTRKFESTYVALEYLLDIGYVVAVIVTFGVIFGWHSTIPVWYLVVMAITIYAFAVLTSIVRIRKDAKEINELLRKRRKKNANTAS